MIKLDPNDGNLYDSYGEALMIFGDYKEAIKMFEKAVKISPKAWFCFQTYLKMGTSYEKLSDLDKAEEYYIKGKEFNDKMHPLKQDMYAYKANEKLEGLRKLREKLEK